MTDQSRTLPSRPNLRYLKLEAKRRLAAGEFATLHDAHLAIAREHGLPSWAKLKERITATASEANPALRQVRWVLARFAGAGGPGWTAPDGDELSEHFDEGFLRLVPPDQLVSTITPVAGKLSGELTVAGETPTTVRARIADLQVEAVAEAGPPHRLTGLRAYPVGDRVTDPRASDPATHTDGNAPALAVTHTRDALAELGLPGLVLAGATAREDTGATPGGGISSASGASSGRAFAVWAVARGWADLERGEDLRPSHRFPVYSVTKAVTAVTVLVLVADGQVVLDRPANDYLRTVRLASDAVTVRELLSHTGGADSPDELWADTVPSLLALTGPVLACGGPRGTFAYSNGGYAVLGQLIADVTGSPYPAVVTGRVLRPLAMHDSSFPERWPARGAVTGYRLDGDGLFEPAPAQVTTVPAAGGLWATAADLARFGRDWRSLLPPALAREALRPQADRDPDGAQMGLGWLLHQPKDLYGHAGGGQAGASSLLISLSTGEAVVALASRLIPIESVSARLIRPVG